MARPFKEIDADQVYKLASLGCKVTEIADFFGCDRDTIHNRFQDELTKGKADLKMSVRRWQLETAKKGNATMQIWLGKQILDQKESVDVTSEGKKLEIKLSYDRSSE
jgi:hypothetical protein